MVGLIELIGTDFLRQVVVVCWFFIYIFMLHLLASVLRRGGCSWINSSK